MQPLSFSQLKLAYLTLAGARMCVLLILQIIYTHLVKLAQEKPDDRVVKEQIQLVYNLLTQLGANYRSLNGAGAFAYAFFAYLIVVQYIITPLFYAKYLNVKENSLFTLLSDPNLSQEQTWSQLQECLRDVLQSSAFYELNFRQHFRAQSNKRVFSSTGSYDGNTNPELAAQLDAGRKLQDHRSHLQGLLSLDQAGHWIWPKTRTSGWRQTMQSSLFWLYVVILMSFWLSGHFSTLVAHSLGHNFVQQNELVPEDLRHSTRLDMLALIDLFFLVLILQHRIGYQLTLTLIIIRDQLKLLNLLKARIKSYLVESTSASCRIDCDREATAIYLSLAYYRRNLPPALNFVGVFISQTFTFAIAIALTLFSYIRSMRQDELKIVTFMSMVLAVGLNIIFLASAYFTAQSVHLIRRIGSLIGSSVGLYMSPMMNSDDNDSLSSLSSSSHTVSSGNQTTTTGGTSRRRRLSDCRISGHALLLWRRLLADQDRLVDNFTCEIYGGLLKVNLMTVLRINFVCLSAVIFVLTK